MSYYIKEGQSSIFSRMKIVENECQIPEISSNSKKIEKIVKKMKKKNIDQVILSKELKQKQEFVQILNNYDIAICDGKWLMQYMLQNIIVFLNKNGKIVANDEITILANDLTNEVKENIKKFSDSYKKIRIVTNHSEKFRRLEEELYDKKGIAIILTNNKRKALSQSMLIINFDFVQEVIDQYNINEKAIIINLNDKIKINKKRFSGLIITDYEVEFRNLNQLVLEEILHEQKEFCLKEILEGKIYSTKLKVPNYSTFDTIINLIEEHGIDIKELYGINGVLK